MTIRYDSPEWKRMSQCLVRLGIYGTEKCRLANRGAHVYDCGGAPALLRNRYNNRKMTMNKLHELADQAVALLNEKYPEYEWHRSDDSIIIGEPL